MSLFFSFAANVYGSLSITQAFLPLLRKSTIPGYTKRISFISSIPGAMALPAIGGDSASKHALEGLADVFRRELQSWDIDVTVAQFGSIDTEKSDEKRDDIKREVTTPIDDSPIAKRYASMGTRMMKASDSVELKTSTTVTSALIESMLLDVVPKTRYRAGWDSFLVVPLFSLFPDRLRDLILASAFRKP